MTIELGDDHVVLTLTNQVRLRRKEFQLLQALLQRAGKIVSKEQLVRIVWGRVQRRARASSKRP